MQLAEKRLLNAGEGAAYVGTTKLNIYQMASKGLIPFVKIGRSLRFDRFDLDKWIDAKKVGKKIGTAA